MQDARVSEYQENRGEENLIPDVQNPDIHYLIT